MTLKIQKKIVGYDIVKPDEPQPQPQPQPQSPPPTERRDDASRQDNVAYMHEKVERPAMLIGSTYKIKTPVSEHAFYITINDIILNPATPYEKRRPFEMFINSKNMDHYQWISALTLIVSAVFRKGGDVIFLVDELKSVFDPKGGYFRKGGRFMPSLVAEIGDAIESHLKMIGMMSSPAPDPHQQQLLNQRRAEFEQRQRSLQTDATPAEPSEPSEFPPGAELCDKCLTKAMVVMDNCLTCLNCGESKCS